MASHDADEEAPGWDAVEAAFLRLYPGQDSPQHWATVMPQRVLFGGPEALDGVSAYEASEPAPHFHWVSFGLTELYAKENDDPDWSGWGYELTMRVPRGEGHEPSPWPLNVIRQLANYAHRQKRLLEPGQWFDTGRTITDGPCELTGLGFVTDPELPPLDTPNGRVELVGIIGLHPQELAFCKEHGAEELLRRAGRAYAGEFNVLVRESFV